LIHAVSIFLTTLIFQLGTISQLRDDKPVSNAAGAYPSTSWLPGGLLDAVSLGRGGALDFGYSNDGARDLVSITWPEVSSAGFPDEPFYGGAITITARDDTGNITRLVDPSGERDMDYEKNRLTTTDWLSGELDAYKVVREPDEQGRPDKVTLYRNGTAIHQIDRDFTGLSHEIGGVDTDGFAAVVTRDTISRHVTGFTRGGVTQSWGRGTAGRITSAGGNVTGAPSFAYNSFDPKGRRKSVQTNRGTWFYDYSGGDNGDGQLDTASNGTLNASVDYNFDGIGRRDFGGNQQDALNRFLAMTHPIEPKKLFITADPLAKLWIDGTAMTPFNGGWTHPLAHPGSAGGWVPWTVKGVLEGAGDAGAFEDAVAELSGNTWFPPTSENFTFDEDGNRESSALWNYGWNGRNQLVRARTKTWDSAPQGWDVSFDYDAEGRRFKKTATRYEDGEPVEQKVIYFVWDGWDLLYERHEDIQGNLLLDRRYVWGPDNADGAAGGAGGLLLIREKRGTIVNDYYPLFDGTGHVTGLADSAGSLAAEYWYGPFGELLEAKGEMADANPFRYATKYYDNETGLCYFGHRYYDPVSGQFLSREPLGESESLNLYSYAGNDPVNHVDVQGLATVAIDGNVTSSLELLSATLAKLGKPETSSILDQAMGRNADWVAYRQTAGMGGSFGQYIVGILTAHEGPAVRDVGLENRLRMWARSATSSELTAAADSGNFDSRLIRMLHDQSQAASNAAHDWQIVSETTQGATIIAQPDYLLLKGATAGILAIKGLSMADDALRIGIRAEGVANDLRPLRVTQYFDPKMGAFPGDGRFALWSEATLGNRLVDGVAGPTTWVAPHAASDMSMWRRLMTGVGNRRNYVEFDALPSEFASPSGLKSLFGRYQQVIPGQVDLIPRNATFGTSEFNWLDAGFRYGVPSASAAGGGYLFYNSNQ
jgi:RHS repeat-associated protein